MVYWLSRDFIGVLLKGCIALVALLLGVLEYFNAFLRPVS